MDDKDGLMKIDDRDIEDILQVPRSTVKALITSKSGWLDQVGRQLDISGCNVGICIISCDCLHAFLRCQNNERSLLHICRLATTG